MSKEPKAGKPSADYAVGYGRPPVESRFQPGRSGNPRGRPRGLKSIGQVIAETLKRRVTIQEGGRQRKMRMQDVIIQGLVNDAARRDPRALKQLFALIDRYCDVDQQDADAASLLPDDQAIIDAFLNSPQASKDASKSAAPNDEQPVCDEKPEAAAGSGKEDPHGDD